MNAIERARLGRLLTSLFDPHLSLWLRFAKRFDQKGLQSQSEYTKLLDKMVGLPTKGAGMALDQGSYMSGASVGARGDAPAITPMQEAMRLHALAHPGMELQQVVLQSDERFGWDRLVAAWRWVLERHPGLRVVFDTSDPSCTRQRVVSTCDEIPTRATLEGRAELESFLERDREASRPTERPLGGVTLLSAPTGDILVWTHHHANVDGRSIAVVMSDLLCRYDKGTAYDPPREGDLDGVLQARAALNADVSVDYFVEKLQGIDEATPTPGALAHRGDGKAITAESHASLDATTLSTLRALGKEHGFTFANAVQLAWALVISRYTFRDDVVVGVTRSGRFAVDGAKGVVGCLINTIPLRVRLEAENDCLSALQALREDTLAARPHEAVPLARVRTRLGLETGLLDTVIVHEGHTLQLRMRQLLGEEAVIGRTFSIRSRSAPGLVLALKEDEDRPIVVKVEYRADKIAKYVADSLPERLTSVLRQFALRPERLLSSISVAEPHERSPFSSRVPAGPQPVSLTGELRSIVSARPKATAIVELSTGLCLSYAELLDAASAFSRRLRALDVKQGDVVAVSARASAETVVAFWGCAFVGAVYLPIDPDYPRGRREHMLTDSGARTVALSAAEPRWAGDSVDYVIIPTRGDGQPPFEAVSNDLDEPLYLIYTSGSSGTPKGVVIATRALLHHAAAVSAKYGLAHYDSVLQFASPSFDVWFEEVVPTALVGASLVVRDEKCARSIEHLLERVREHRVSVLQLPTAFFNELVSKMTRSGAILPATVRLAIIGGERANAAACAQFGEAHPEVRLVNAYGPTEATITSLAFAMHGEDRVHGEVPIGRPLGDTLAWVVDTCGHPSPPGAIGELVLAGPQLALEYHACPAQTEAAFPNDVETLNAPRTYRTGDLAFANQDAELVYVGRADEQVKLRGYRIEVGDVESALCCLDGVAEGVVVFHQGSSNEAQLVAWVVPTAGSAEGIIKTELGARLPHYMVPANVCFVERLPICPGGKVDRRGLSRQVPTHVDSSSNEAAAASPLVRRLAKLFSAVVATHVGPDDDFFDMGGHSLRVIRLVSDIRDSMGLDVGAGAVFAARTPRRLAERLQAESFLGSGAAGIEFVALNEARSDKGPMYCILGIDVYRPLAERLAPRPVFGVYVPEEELRGDGMMPPTEELASAYRDAIATRGTQRARSVCGVSYGAVVALELAQQRAAAGDPLDLLVLLDPVLPERKVHGRWDSLHNLMHRVRYQKEELGERVLRRLGLLSGAEPPAGAPDSEADQLAWLERRERYSVALQDYASRLRPYSQPCVVFIARDRRPTALRDNVKRWRELLGPFARVEVMPGDHGTFINPPRVDELAERLGHLLDHAIRD